MKSKFLLLFFILSLNFYAQNLSKEDSLLIEKYYNAGLPSLNREWSPNDFKTAVDAILAGYKNKTLKLPDHKDATRIIFEKITDYHTYWFIESDKFSTAQQLLSQSQMVSAIGQMLSTYAMEGNTGNKKLKYSYEVATSMITSLILMDKMISSANIIAQESSLTESQQQGMKQIKQGTSTVMSGIFQTLEKESQFYEPKEICDLSDVFFGFYNKHKNYIDVTSKGEFDRRKTKLSKDGKSECIRTSASSVEVLK